MADGLAGHPAIEVPDDRIDAEQRVARPDSEYMQHREKVKARKGRDPAVHGKQSVKKLLGQNQGAANAEIEKEGIKGKDTTPYLLAKVKDLTKGESLESNIKLVYNNAKVGSLIANELCALRK